MSTSLQCTSSESTLVDYEHRLAVTDQLKLCWQQLVLRRPTTATWRRTRSTVWQVWPQHTIR